MSMNIKDKLSKLRRVLLAYVRHNPRLGYCQGFNFVASKLLEYLEEEETFWILVEIIKKVPSDYFTTMVCFILLYVL